MIGHVELACFIDSLRNSLHLTQGPPGTGKSYLGVVIVRALMIIRSLWVRKNSSVSKLSVTTGDCNICIYVYIYIFDIHMAVSVLF